MDDSSMRIHSSNNRLPYHSDDRHHGLVSVDWCSRRRLDRASFASIQCVEYSVHDLGLANGGG